MELRDTIVGILSQTLNKPAELIKDESKLIELAEDSIALFEVLIRFETLLGKNISYEDIANVETVGDIVAFAHTLPQEVIEAALIKSHITIENIKVA